MEFDPDLSALDARLRDAGADGYLIDAGSDDSDQRYLSGFSASDPFVTLYTGETHLLVKSLEYGRARRESRADTVGRPADYVREAYSHRDDHAVLAEFLAAHGAGSVLVPPRFPLSTADALRGMDVEVTAEERSTVTGVRAVKTDAEVEQIRRTQEANERAMGTVERLLREASVAGGELVHDGEPLTSGRVREEVEVALLREGCGMDEAVVACGADAADPHDRGRGPLRADEPIVVDIFPRSKATGYHADMARTFLKGEPGDTVREWHDLTCEAVDAALGELGPGADGGDVHGAVCDVYEAAGLPTLRADESTETGFIHSTGHGVGLDVHEDPRLRVGGDTLEPGHVVTVEPGLYDPEVGGVRVEDLLVVTEDGYENLTDYHRDLVV